MSSYVEITHFCAKSSGEIIWRWSNVDFYEWIRNGVLLHVLLYCAKDFLFGELCGQSGLLDGLLKGARRQVQVEVF